MEGAAVDHLAHERIRAEFDVEAMKIAWAGSKHAVDVADRMARLVASDPVFKKDDRMMLGRKELFKNTLRKAAHAWRRINELRLTEEEASMLRIFVDEPGYVDLHWGMFVPAIKGQGTDEQQKKWLPLAYKMQIIGCYAQTELGHGSNVQGLETTATFDPKTDEFIIHSPTLTSSKWWPGGLGKISTHAVVYARLITDGKDHGINGFIVQLRSLDDHSPLPGIVVGDIGTKFGNGAYNTMDNGVLRFDHVRIPRNQMLMRVSQVTREGKFVQSDVPRQLLYGTMVYVRQTIVSDASKALSRAVCIAVRYSAVRRQFGSQDGCPETQVIDYKTQQSRLFPLLASAYAFRFVGEWLKWLYRDVTERLQANDFSTLPEAHACTAGLKSLTTSVTADGIEECRKLCGGHGYLCSSGLPELFAVYVPACTYEGDNVVLHLQVARFLMKTVSQLGSGKKPVGTTAYMGSVQHLMQSKCDVLTAEDWLKPSVILEAFEARAIRLAINCAKNISKFPSQEEGFSELSADLLEVAIAHCQLIIVSKFIDKVKEDIQGHGVKELLQILCNVYALSLVHKHLGDFISTGYITPKQGALANEQLRFLYAQVRPNAVALVDAFNYTDHYLGSILGRYDGNVYPKLYEEAWKDPLNDTVVPDGYHEYVRPLLKQKFTVSRM
ncbi:peroxisomal acyl-coenzyme A oxidase 1-like [Musa acuminata AAA Group]|uniref:peroxisomal acyl-coenzyme A oxidase 1-like n=1 Tax=Musa acuminata AAA Group TaxID=214697 RepID=UPI0031D8CA62